MEKFEKASRMKLRFDVSMGSLSVEDLWDIPLVAKNKVSLDSIAKDLNRRIKESDNESFVVKTYKTDEVLELKFEIVKHIIDVRLEEQDKAEKEKVSRAKKQQIMGLISQKKNEQLLGSSIEELEKMLNEL